MTNHVKINGTPPRIQYVADGQNTIFEFPFAIFKESNLRVYLGSDIQSETDYSVEIDEIHSCGKVTFNRPPLNGTIITLLRNLQIERTTDFQEGGALRAKTLNDELDYQIACQQQIADNLNRSMVLPPYAADIDVDLTLPLPKAGKAIVWNSEGTNLENSTVSVNALEATLNEYKTIAENAANTAISKATEADESAGIAIQKASEALAAASEYSTKANKDMDNLTQVGKENLIALYVPDYSAGIDISVYNSEENQFTTPCTGEIRAILNTNSTNGIWVNNVCVSRGNSNDIYNRQQFAISVSKNDRVYIVGGATLGPEDSRIGQTFYPMKGI